MRRLALCCALALLLATVQSAVGCATGDDVDGASDDDGGGGQGGAGQGGAGQGAAGGAGTGQGGTLLTTSSGGGSGPCDPDEECICGNGVQEMGEECDDGNTMPGDGCDENCKVEPQMMCSPDGVYQVQGAPLSYTCCSGLVTINVSSFIFTAGGASISSSPSNPVTMTGSATTCPMGDFINSGSIPGGCTETYTLDGSYTGDDTWSGIYTVQFTGGDCDCFGGMLGTPCISQTYPVTAMRP